MYRDYYNTPSTITTKAVVGIDGTWMIIAAVIAIIGGIVAYFLFINKKQEKSYSPFLIWLHDFLNFKQFFIEAILKTTYAISAIFITLSSFALIGSSVAGFFLYLILGNVALRIIYELIMLTITLVNNTTEINKKMK